jgi:outer membrane protein TolC
VNPTLALLALLLAAPIVSADPAAPPAISFDEAVARARARALTSVLAGLEIRRADGLLTQARSGSLPTLALNGTATRLDAARRSPAGLVQPAEQTSANLQAALTLSPSRWYQWSHAGDQLDAARAGSDDAQRSAALTAGRAYLTVVGQKRVVDVSRRAMENAQAHFDFAHARREAGVGNALDELRADQQLATSAAQLEAVLTGLARAQEALGQATGEDGPLDAEAEPSMAAPAAGESSGAIAARRADVQAADARARAAARVARDSWADWLPSLLGTFTDFRQDWSTAASPGRGWQAQAILSFPLFEGGLRVGQARERGALEAEGAAQLESLLRQARSEVRAAWASLQHAEASLLQSRRAAGGADRVLSLVTEAYRAGSTTSLDVTDAQQRARDAETAAAVVEDAVRQARLDLLAATGHFPEAGR